MRLSKRIETKDDGRTIIFYFEVEVCQTTASDAADTQEYANDEPSSP